jgi:hypothetical protein
MTTWRSWMAFAAVTTVASVMAGDRAATAQPIRTVLAPPRAQLAVHQPPGWTVNAPLISGDPNNSAVQISPVRFVGGASVWRVAILGASPPNGWQRTITVCNVDMPSLQDAATLKAQIMDERTKYVVCTGTIASTQTQLGRGDGMSLDLTGPLPAGQGFSIAAD